MKYIFILAKDLTFSRGYFRNIVTLRHQVDILWGLALKSLSAFVEATEKINMTVICALGGIMNE